MKTPSRLPEDLLPYRLLDEHQAAEILRVHRGTLSNMRARGKGPKVFRCGRAIRYSLPALLEWAEKGDKR
jgi:hypothetical protein